MLMKYVDEAMKLDRYADRVDLRFGLLEMNDRLMIFLILSMSAFASSFLSRSSSFLVAGVTRVVATRIL
jgi:hypothetical protein